MAGFEMEMENGNRFEQVETSADLTERRNELINDLSNAITEGTNPSHIIRIRQQINETDDKIFSAIICETKSKIDEQINVKNETLAQITELRAVKANKRRRLNKALDFARLRETKLMDVQLQIEYRENVLESARESLGDLHKKFNLLKTEKLNEVMKKYE
jgi:H2-forming N5,N10-methylenetetrahydromethanopterin dehydrogenase-like enzyme